MAKLGFVDNIKENSKDIDSMEQLLGASLLQPFTNTNAGARKLMHTVHKHHVFSLIHPEKAILETGYEIRFGDYSSSITKADTNYRVIGKVSKFSFAPNHHYWLLIENLSDHSLDIIERISYQYITESYGYLYNNEYMDSLSLGDIISKDTIVQKSLAFDEYNNRSDGMNLNVAYLALDDNMEDSIIFSDEAASKLTSSLIKPVEIMINDNDIPINLYGDGNIYKIIPDIGEDIKDANLIALRREKKEESFFNQSIANLNKLMISDEKKQVHGKVIDINMYCNNPDILDLEYYAQIKMYYNEQQRYNKELVQLISPYAANNYKMSYETQKLYGNAKRVMNHDQYIDKRPFSNIILEVVVLEEKTMDAGDKASNRYGGKGVVSEIIPKSLMPRFKNASGEYEYVDVIFNSSTMVNRENVGQTFELSLNHIGNAIVNKIIADKIDLHTAYDMIHKFVSMCSADQAQYMDERKSYMSEEELGYFVESILNSGNIHLSMRPISDSMSIDKLNEIYKEFPWIKQNELEVVIHGSDGTPRYVKARRSVVVGKQYIYRLKQFSEEKFSATSLSATNIRNENTKSRVKKDYKELYPNTPIRFGSMETNDMAHAGVEVLITNMMIHSLSPQARRLVEQMYTCDPFNIDIKLDSDSKNRSAEIANTYLKAIGRKIEFIKKRKVYTSPILISPIEFTKDPHDTYESPISFIPKELLNKKDFDPVEYMKKQEQLTNDRKNDESPLIFMGVRKDKNGVRISYKESKKDEE